MPQHRGTPRIGLALSGGTLKAAAHAGVLMVLDELGIRPHCVAGTSAGSWVAALYAHGYRGRDMLSLVNQFPGFRLLDWGHPIWSSLRTAWYYGRRTGTLEFGGPLPSGILKGRRLLRYFRRTLGGRTASLPYYIVATDLISGNPIVFTNDVDILNKEESSAQMDPALAVLASCALPGLLPPVRVSPWLLVDGAFRHYVPVDVLRAVGCDKIIVVNLYRLQREWLPRTTLHILVRSLDILLQESIDNDIGGTDVWTICPAVGDMTWWSVHQLRKCFNAGVAAASETAPGLVQWLHEPSSALSERVAVIRHTRMRPAIVYVSTKPHA